MPNAVWFFSYRLAEGASVPDYLLASENVFNEVISKQKGFISWKQLVDGDVWADLVTWETMDDARNALNAGEKNPVAQKFYSFVGKCTDHIFSVEKTHK